MFGSVRQTRWGLVSPRLRSESPPSPHQTWLTVDPPFGMVSPGETAQITFTVTVDDAVARDVSLGREITFPTAAAAASAPAVGGLLEEILVLRVERSRDHYLAVVAAVLPSAFGCSLAQLARRPEPMRALGLTATATIAMNVAAGITLGAVPSATNAAAAVLATGGNSAQQAAAAARAAGPAPPDLTAGSHRLSELLAEDESDEAAATLRPGDSSRKGSAVLSVPKEIWRLVDAIYRRCAPLLASISTCAATALLTPLSRMRFVFLGEWTPEVFFRRPACQQRPPLSVRRSILAIRSPKTPTHALSPRSTTVSY